MSKAKINNDTTIAVPIYWHEKLKAEAIRTGRTVKGLTTLIIKTYLEGLKK